jgi:hypothetical protein
VICKIDGCENNAHPNYQGECYKHAKMGIGFRLQGGGVIGSNAWNTTRREFLTEHIGVSSEKELARTRPNIERAP